jgi:hypothetical protein
MARPRKRKPPVAPPRGRTSVRDYRPLTISIEDAAALLGMSKRTLMGHLRRTNARCLIRLGNYRLDYRGFFLWCRSMGFESANAAVGGGSH